MWYKLIFNFLLCTSFGFLLCWVTSWYTVLDCWGNQLCMQYPDGTVFNLAANSSEKSHNKCSWDDALWFSKIYCKSLNFHDCCWFPQSVSVPGPRGVAGPTGSYGLPGYSGPPGKQGPKVRYHSDILYNALPLRCFLMHFDEYKSLPWRWMRKIFDKVIGSCILSLFLETSVTVHNSVSMRQTFISYLSFSVSNAIWSSFGTQYYRILENRFNAFEQFIRFLEDHQGVCIR